MGTNVILTWAKTTEDNCVGTYVSGHDREVVDLGRWSNEPPFASLRVGDYNCELLSQIFSQKYWDAFWNRRGLGARPQKTIRC